MSKMERLIGVGRAELYHYILPCLREVTEVPVAGNLGKEFIPIEVGEQKVQETFHAVESRYFGNIYHEPIPYCLACVFGSGTGYP